MLFLIKADYYRKDIIAVFGFFFNYNLASYVQVKLVKFFLPRDVNSSFAKFIFRVKMWLIGKDD